MKKLITIGSFLGLVVALFTGCDKQTEEIAKWENVDQSKALLKINFVSPYALNPSVQLKVNDQRVSNLITFRTPFPGGGYNTGGGSANDYLAVTPGTTNVTVSIPNRLTATDSVVLFNTSVTLNAGKNYSVHITDTAANTKVVLLEDDISKPDTGLIKYRFINLMPNVPAIDLYNGTTLVASNVPYLGNSGYFTITRQTISTTWTIREAGTSPTSTALATYTSGNTTLHQRVYTAFASGYKGQTSTSVRRPFISFYLNL